MILCLGAEECLIGFVRLIVEWLSVVMFVLILYCVGAFEGSEEGYPMGDLYDHKVDHWHKPSALKAL